MLALAGALLLAARARAISDANKCEAAKNKIAGKYAFCRALPPAECCGTRNTVCIQEMSGPLLFRLGGWSGGHGGGRRVNEWAPVPTVAEFTHPPASELGLMLREPDTERSPTIDR